MESLTSPKVLKDLLSRHGFNFTKSLGQNFLIDDNILRKIVKSADLSKGDMVLEIGPGVGTMTRELAKSAGTVVTVEIDKKLIPILSETLGQFDNVEIVNDDILKVDLRELVALKFEGKPFSVVANLPYYITTPIIMRFLEEDLNFNKMVMLVQKEVAQRMAAKPGQSDYGALSVAVQYYTEPELIGRVSPKVFMPPPKVESMIIGLKKREAPPVVLKDKALFFRVVKAVFGQRRKTLLNNLYAADIFKMDKNQLGSCLSSIGIDPGRRGETLDFNELGEIANQLDQNPDQ